MPTDDRVRCISLTKGLFALVDAADYEWLSQYKWRTTGGSEGYARATIAGKNVFMHRLIMNPPAGKVVDHINQNRWDNRRDNLRECTQAENLRNRRSLRGTSRFKGVHWNARIRKWVATICLNRKLIHLGYFDDEVAAAHAYDEKARELFGPFAYLNFPRRIVLLSGRIEAHSSAHARLHVTSKNMPARSVSTTPHVALVYCHSDQGQRPRGGICPGRSHISLSQPDSSIPLRSTRNDKVTHRRSGTSSPSWTRSHIPRIMPTGPPQVT